METPSLSSNQSGSSEMQPAFPACGSKFYSNKESSNFFDSFSPKEVGKEFPCSEEHPGGKSPPGRAKRLR
jgi:hypothetical protein